MFLTSPTVFALILKTYGRIDIMTLVSVVIPFYNNVEWLEEAIKSVIDQHHNPLEIIVVIDGAKECTKKLEASYQSITFIHKCNGGSASARNRGLDEANGEYIAFLDSDDLWPKNKIKDQLFFMEVENADVSYHDYYYYDDNKKTNVKKITFTNYAKEIWLRSFVSNKIQISTVMISKAVSKSGIRLDEDFRHGQDIEYFKELALHYDFLHCGEICSRFRVKKGSIGFNPSMQLKYKSHVYHKIKNKRLKLPKAIMFAYYLANLSFILDSVLNKRKLPLVSGLLYFPHYILLRLCRPLL